MKVALPSRAPRSKEWTTSVGEVASYKDMGDLLPRRRAPRILVVDDQASIAGLISQLLTIRGYEWSRLPVPIRPKKKFTAAPPI